MIHTQYWVQFGFRTVYSVDDRDNVLFLSHLCGVPPSFRYQHGFVGPDKNLLVAVVSSMIQVSSEATFNKVAHMPSGAVHKLRCGAKKSTESKLSYCT